MLNFRAILWGFPACALFAIAPPAYSAWPADGVAVCTAPNQQYFPTLLPDGAGGAFITWYDNRPGGSNYDIYVQHVLVSGDMDPSWPVNGLAVCTAANGQYYPQIISDGAGGAIITWQDLRGGIYFDIYAHHLLASGVMDPSWPADGLPVSTALNNQYAPKLVSDGAGGAIITWYDLRGAVYYDIYAQRVTASGTVDLSWPADGVAICTALYDQFYPYIVTDGAGGAIITWYDRRNDGSTSDDIYAQRVLVTGVVDPSWTVDGVPLCTALSNQADVRIIADGTGGAIATWHDFRAGTKSGIFAQRVQSGGSIASGWPMDGVAVCTADTGQVYPSITSDGAGGAFIAWQDLRNGVANYDVYVHRVLASGVTDPGWPVNGLAVCTASKNQYFPIIVEDGTDGALITWSDRRDSDANDIYAHRVTGAGSIHPTWPVDGIALCKADNFQANPIIAGDGVGGAMVAWYDLRSGVSYDIYAQIILGDDVTSVLPNEPIPGTILKVVSNPGPHLFLSFSLPTNAPASIDVMDAKGRRFLSHKIPAPLSGVQWLSPGADVNIPPGVYFVRLTQEDRSVIRKAVITP